MSEAPEKVIETLRKLMALHERPGTQGEAEAVAARISHLLAMHNLEMSDVELASQDRDNPICEEMFEPGLHGLRGKGQREYWSELLAEAVAEGHFCKTLIASGSNTVWFVGRTANRQVAIFMYELLCKAALDLASEASELYAGQLRLRGFYGVHLSSARKTYRKSWLRGFANAVGVRYAATRKSDMKEAGKRAIVLVNALKDVEAYVDQKFSRFNTTFITRTNGAGLADGARAGRSVSLESRAIDKSGRPAQGLRSG